jgi:SAM-dependent methyltransferase
VAQINEGIRSVLGLPLVYKAFNLAIGRASRYRAFIDAHIAARAGDRVLDIGCGTGDILEFLPDVSYVGFDLSPEYIESARQRFGSRGEFRCEKLDGSNKVAAGTFDIVLALGVLHHLDDHEAVQLFKLAHEALRPGGRLVTIDGCFTDEQSSIARYLLRRDRGQNVRTEAGYRGVAEQVFSSVKSTTITNLLRVPYTHVTLTCEKS